MKFWHNLKRPVSHWLQQFELKSPSVHESLFSRRIGRLLKYTVPTFFALLIILNSLGIARTYVCPNHSGSILKMAVDVSEGMVLYRDTYSQYGPLPTWIQALAVLLFGKNLIVIYLVTAIAYAIAVWSLYFIWSRILPWWGAGLSVCVLVSTLPYVGLPWSNYFLTTFSVLATYSMMRFMETHRRWLVLLTGLLLGCAVLCRQQGLLAFGSFLFFVGSLWYVAGMKLKRVAAIAGLLCSGCALVVGSFFVWLLLTGAVTDWYLQTIKIIHVAYGQYNDIGIVSKIKTTLTGMIDNTLFYVTGTSNSLYDGTPTGWAFFGVTVLLYLVLPWVRRLSRKAVEGPDVLTYLFACASLAGWTQIYPLPDSFRITLGLAPGIGLLLYLFWIAIRGHGGSIYVACVLIGAIAMLYGPKINYLYNNSRLTLLKEIHGYPGLVGVKRPLALKGSRMPEQQAEFYLEVDETLRRYVRMYPGTKFISTGVEPLLLTFVERNENFHPMCFSWWSQTGSMKGDGVNHTTNVLLYPDYLITLESYISKKRPLILNYGEYREGYMPIFTHPGTAGIPVGWATQWTVHPVVAIQAPVERAELFLRRYGTDTIRTARRVPISHVSVDRDGGVDPLHPPGDIADDSLVTFLSILDENPIERWIQADLGASSMIRNLKFYPRVGFPETFPSSFVIEASQNGKDWIVLAKETSYTAMEGKAYEVNCAPVAARYVRLKGYTRQYRGGGFFVQIAEIQVF